MTDPLLIGGAIGGLVINTLGLFTIIWRGGELSNTIKTLAVEVGLLREWRAESSNVLSRVVVLVDTLERRVSNAGF